MVHVGIGGFSSQNRASFDHWEFAAAGGRRCRTMSMTLADSVFCCTSPLGDGRKSLLPYGTAPRRACFPLRCVHVYVGGGPLFVDCAWSCGHKTFTRIGDVRSLCALFQRSVGSNHDGVFDNDSAVAAVRSDTDALCIRVRNVGCEVPRWRIKMMRALIR